MNSKSLGDSTCSLNRGPRPARWQACLQGLIFGLIALDFVFCHAVRAQIASRFTLSVGEEYNDNIFFTKSKTHDFITNISPTFTILYQPLASSFTTLNLNITPRGQIYALNPEENNFGDGLNINGGYIHQISPRLDLSVQDTFQTVGRTLTGNTTNQPTFTPTGPPTPGVPISSLNIANFIPNGRTLNNQFTLTGTFRYAPDINFTAGYTNSFVNYLDQGGSDLTNQMGVRASYKWRQEHNLYAGYTVDVIRSRDNGTSVVHNFNIGDDYFSNTRIELTPTLTLGFSTGVSLNTSDQGPRVANNTNVQLTKVWERASLRFGVFKGLTSSFGVSGVSDTTDLVNAFNILLTERLSANAGVNYSLFDTDDVNFKPLQIYGGLQYGITSWLCSALNYSHRRLFSGSGGQNTVLQTRGNVYGNSVFLLFSASFNVWPSVGFATGSSCAPGSLFPGPQFPHGSREIGVPTRY